MSDRTSEESGPLWRSKLLWGLMGLYALALSAYLWRETATLFDGFGF